jgi:hypothetical protein
LIQFLPPGQNSWERFCFYPVDWSKVGGVCVCVCVCVHSTWKKFSELKNTITINLSKKEIQILVPFCRFLSQKIGFQCTFESWFGDFTWTAALVSSSTA